MTSLRAAMNRFPSVLSSDQTHSTAAKTNILVFHNVLTPTRQVPKLLAGIAHFKASRNDT